MLGGVSNCFLDTPLFVRPPLQILIEEKYNTDKMAYDSQIYQQVPHEVVISKTLLGIEPRTYGVEDTARTNQR